MSCSTSSVTLLTDIDLIGPFKLFAAVRAGPEAEFLPVQDHEYLVGYGSLYLDYVPEILFLSKKSCKRIEHVIDSTAQLKPLKIALILSAYVLAPVPVHYLI